MNSHFGHPLCSCVVAVAREYVLRGVHLTDQALQSNLAQLESTRKELQQLREERSSLEEQNAELERRRARLEGTITERTAVAATLSDSGTAHLRRLVGFWYWACIHLKDRRLAPDSREYGFTWERDVFAPPLEGALPGQGRVCYRVRAVDAEAFPGCSEIEFTEEEWTSIQRQYELARDPASVPALAEPEGGLPLPLLGKLAEQYRDLEDEIAEGRIELLSLQQQTLQAKADLQLVTERAAAVQLESKRQEERLQSEAQRSLLHAQSMSMVIGNQALQLAVQLQGGAHAQLGAASAQLGTVPSSVWFMPAPAAAVVASPWQPPAEYPAPAPAVAADAATIGQLQHRSDPSMHTAALQRMMQGARLQGMPRHDRGAVLPRRIDFQRAEAAGGASAGPPVHALPPSESALGQAQASVPAQPGGDVRRRGGERIMFALPHT